MVIDTDAITGWMTSKTTISAIASAIVYIGGVRGWIDYPTALQISTILGGLAAVFMRNAIQKVNAKVDEVQKSTGAG